MSSEPLSVVVLYVHSLLGEGLARLLNAESGLDVVPVEIRAGVDLDRALTAEPDAVIYEAGGPVGLEQVLAATRCPLVVEVSLDTGDAWVIRRQALRTRPDDLVAAIVDACLARPVQARPRMPRRPALESAPIRA